MKSWDKDCAAGDYWIDNAMIVDPQADRVFSGCLKVSGGKVAELRDGDAPSRSASVDAGGLHLAPGLVDMHVHLREPGFEDKETIASGARAAARGGVTAMACMPNTSPACDSESVVRMIRRQAEAAGLCRVLPVGAITQVRASRQLADMGEMLGAGAVAFSDDGSPVESTSLLRSAMELSLAWDALLISHAEDTDLAEGGQMHEGAMSTRLGLKGIPREAEDIATYRDIRLAALTGARLHIAHVSSAGAVDIIRRAKAEGVRVTAETAPHYLLLDDTALTNYDTHKKMNPPLREQSDQDALIAAILDGTLDCVATDHAPHTEIDKQVEFAYAPFGVTGLETSLAAVITRLVAPGLIGLPDALRLLSSRPAEILGRGGGSLVEGSVADLVLFDPTETWTVRGAECASLAANTAFEGLELTGRVAATFLAGQPVYRRLVDGEKWNATSFPEALHV